ncbi:MAG TPA: HAMP domain-containing sensor histidine kinase [Candidatus Saccharimonadales bacterium]|nr:HAMP domain-containing sensor histidine kinase [Candidatus Saccharimonadales bacterium]
MTRRSSAARASRPEPEGVPALEAPLLHQFCHDLRVPLTTLAAYAELLRSPGVGPERCQEFAEALECQARRLARMVDDLEGLSLPAETGPGGEEAGTDVEGCVRAALQEALAVAAARGVTLSFELPPSPTLAGVREEILRRALVWLLEAAIRRSPAGRTVTVSARRRNGEVCVGVDLPGRATDADLAALKAFEPGAAPPDLVSGVAGPLWVALYNLERAGARQEISRCGSGVRWVLALPPG